MSKLGVIVVGQSPRPDVEAEIQAIVGKDVEIDLQGTLDGLSREEIDAIPPKDDGDTLFSRLPNGDAVTISKAAVVQHGEARLAAMEAAGNDIVMVMCTGDFPQWWEKYQVIFPSRVMSAFVEALHPGGRLGIFTPLPEQAAKNEARWQAAGYDTAIVALSPNANDEEVESAAREMADQAPAFLVFDCISYTPHAKQMACKVIGVPGILGVTAAARAASELLN